MDLACLMGKSTFVPLFNTPMNGQIHSAGMTGKNGSAR
jgi:hypothetical protein